MDKVDRLQLIINKHQAGHVSPEDKVYLEQWLSESEENRKLFELLTNDNEMEVQMRIQASFESPHLWDRIKQRINIPETQEPVVTGIDNTELPGPSHVEPIRRSRWLLYPAAAVLVGVLILLIYKLSPGTKPQITITTKTPADTTPPDISAMGSITRTDGSILYLDKNGYLDQQGAYSIFKDNDTVKYKYSHDAATTAGSDLYNVFKAPRGSLYTIVFPNGTNTRLTPAATIRYGVSHGNLQTVEVKGEVWFKAITNKPAFKVKIFRPNNQYLGTAEVTGTTFNIDASDEKESGKITLQEGKLKVYAAVANAGHLQPTGDHASYKVLKPGQQAQLQNGKITIVDNVDIESIVAWQKGTPRFINISNERLMPKLEKWYNIEIDYARSTIPHYIQPNVTIYPGMELDMVLEGLKSRCPGLDVKYK